ncbi:hypothetical protein [Streptomyces sp. NPDC051561]|uniref:hypothetical protein n=1 Tax=Streptomyces sp. NPDC051561 TaxID=3365658 RepID=UPI0037A0D88B
MRGPEPRGLVDTLFGPAHYGMRPPWWLVREAASVSAAAATAVILAGIVGTLSALPAAAAGTLASIVLCGALLYLAVIHSGRLLVGLVGVLGLILAFHVPHAVGEAVLARHGRTQDVVVTAVAHGGIRGSEATRRYCSVARADGTPVAVRLWRGCGPAVAPGDRIAMLADPGGRVAPRGLNPARSALGAVAECGLLMFAFLLLCFVTVLRSCRLDEGEGGR